MVASRRLASFAFAALTSLGVAHSSFANSLPPGPVVGHPADYVIITPSAYASEFQRLAKFKTHVGVPALVKTLEAIVTEYPGGRDDAERVRMFLQDASQQWNTHWALLGGLPPEVPARRVHSTFFGGLDFVTDLYFGSLHGTWDANGNGVFGEGYVSSADPGDSVDLSVQVYIGRAPVRSVAEARDFVNKTIAASAVPFDPTPHAALLAADALFPHPWNGTDPLSLDGADFTEVVRSVIVGTPGAGVTRLYQNWNDPRWPDAQPLSRASLLSELRAGTDFYLDVNFGGPLVMTAANDSVTAADLDALGDAARSTHAWMTGAWCGNFEGDCLAAHFVRGASGGAVTCVAASTELFFTPLLNYQQGYAAALYPPASDPEGEALAAAKAPFIDYSAYDGVHRTTEMALNLIGDPGLQIRPVEPLALEADFPSAVSVGSPGFEVVVTAAGAPLARARVAVEFGDEALAVSMTDITGRAHVELTPAHAGVEALTVTALDGSRLEGAVQVNEALAVERGGSPATRLDAPLPNPAFANARLSGEAASNGSLALFDVGGRRLREFAIAPGRFDLRWDLGDASGRRVPAGLYFARLSSGPATLVQRLLVTR